MSRVEELKEYKELLDSGVITQEEYDAKKQVLLTRSEEPNKTIQTQGNINNNSFVDSINYVPEATGIIGDKSKMVAGLLGIFLGAFGAHNFYLGFKNKAILQLVSSILSILLIILIIGYFTFIGLEIWGFIEGILVIASHKGSKWHLDAAGNELQD